MWPRIGPLQAPNLVPHRCYCSGVSSGSVHSGGGDRGILEESCLRRMMGNFVADGLKLLGLRVHAASLRNFVLAVEALLNMKCSQDGQEFVSLAFSHVFSLRDWNLSLKYSTV